MEFSDLTPSTSGIYQPPVSINFANICENGAKIFVESKDRTRFISEFNQLKEQNPHWSAIRLIRERLKLQMKILNERETQKDLILNDERDSILIPNNHVKMEEEHEYAVSLSASINEQLIQNVNAQIQNDNRNRLQLDQSKVVVATADNFVIIDAGNGKCAVLNCSEFLQQNEKDLYQTDEIELYDASAMDSVSDDVIPQSTYSSNSQTVNDLSFQADRIKHTCPKCFQCFTHLNKYIDHVTKNHFIENNDSLQTM